MRRIFLLAFAASGLLLRRDGGAAAGETSEVKIGYLRRAEQGPAISLLDVAAPDAGLAGAELAIADNNTTGRFLNQKFSITDVKLGPDEDPAAAIRKLTSEGISLVVADLPAAALLKAADAGRSAGHAVLQRGRSGRQPSRGGLPRRCDSRRAVALDAGRWAGAVSRLEAVAEMGARHGLASGRTSFGPMRSNAPPRGSARRSSAEKEFEDKGGARQTDSGIAEIQLQIPLFTQGLPDYDVLVAADESAVFAAYLPTAPRRRGRSRARRD